MATIKIQNKYGVLELTKPVTCPISDEEWFHPLGYCWAYATDIEEGKTPCLNCKEMK